VLKIVENLAAVGGPLRTPLGSVPRPGPLTGGRGLAAPSPEPHPALGLRPRLSALRALFGSLPYQSSFPPMLSRGLDKTLIRPIWFQLRQTLFNCFDTRLIGLNCRHPISCWTVIRI